MKKIIYILLIVLLVVGLVGCGKRDLQNDKSKKDTKQTEVSKGKNVEPKADPINHEQKKHPLPDGTKPYTGIIKKVEGSKVIIDVEGIDYEFKIIDKTNLQKGSEAGKGKVEELKPQMKINVLTQNGIALSVHYE